MPLAIGVSTGTGVGIIGTGAAATYTMGATSTPALMIGGVAAGVFGIVTLSAGVGYFAFKIAKKACTTEVENHTDTEIDEDAKYDETKDVLDSKESLDFDKIMETVYYIEDSEIEEAKKTYSLEGDLRSEENEDI